MGTEDEKCDFKPMEMYRRPLTLVCLLTSNIVGCATLILSTNGKANTVMKPKYSAVPGQELAGVVEQVGSKVTKFQFCDQIVIGTAIDSCLTGKHCKCGDEQKCKKVVATYAGEDWSGRAATHPPTREVPGKPGKAEKSPLIGGYSTKSVIFEHFGIKIGSCRACNVRRYYNIHSFERKSMVQARVHQACQGNGLQSHGHFSVQGQREHSRGSWSICVCRNF